MTAEGGERSSHFAIVSEASWDRGNRHQQVRPLPQVNDSNNISVSAQRRSAVELQDVAESIFDDSAEHWLIQEELDDRYQRYKG